MITINLDESVLHFKVNKWDIPKDGEPALDAAIKTLDEYGAMEITIKGHTDSDGSDGWNAKLSNNRAESVKKYLLKKGIAESRIASVTGVGPKEPIADNKTREGKSKNRRVEIRAVAPVTVPEKK